MELELEIDDDDIPMLEPVVDQRFETATQLLERAASAGLLEPQCLYMLALAYKKQNKTAEARAALRKIAKPDANVILQMGLLSLREGQLAQAEEEFSRAYQLDPQSYAAARNLIFTRLSLGQIPACRDILPRAHELAPDADQARFMATLDELLQYWKPDTPGEDMTLVVLGFDSILETLNDQEEQRLIELVRGLGNLEVTHQLLRALAQTRPRSTRVFDALFDSALARGRELMGRCRWTETSWLLEPLTRERATRAQFAALHNLLGCAFFVTQDFDRAARHFLHAVKNLPRDPRLQQNLALGLEMNSELHDAEQHWDQFFDLLSSVMMPAPPDQPRYAQALHFEILLHLASLFTTKERWTHVINYLNWAHRLRPHEPDVLERLFHAYGHAKQPQNARRTLDKLRGLRPNDPQLDLYELDLVEVKNLTDIERMLTEIDRVMRRYPDDHRVEERAVGMVGNVIPLMGNLCDQLTEQLNRVANQVQHLPRYQIDWSALREVLRDLLREFQKLRRITSKCMPLVASDEHKRIVRDLMDHIDKKIDACRQMGA